MENQETDQTTSSSSSSSSSSSPKFIPFEILIDIFTRLPSKSLVRFASVSKFFYSLIRTPNFITDHLNRSSNATLLLMPSDFTDNNIYSILYETTLLEHSNFKIPWNDRYSEFSNDICFCNGVICISNNFRAWNMLYLCNPSLRKLKILPPSCIDVANDFHYVFGFGVDYVSGDYKVVRIIYDSLNEEVQPEAEVYSLRSDSWKRLELNFILPDIIDMFFSSVFCNGAIHWIADEALDRPRVILCIDLCDEVFREMQLPTGMPFMNRGYVFLFKELLSVFIKTDNENPDMSLEYEVWIMKEYGVFESWTKEFTGLVEGVHKWDVRFSKNGKVILRKNDGMLAILDLECGQLEDIGFRWILYRVSDYVESLVLLEDGDSSSTKPKTLTQQTGGGGGPSSSSCSAVENRDAN